jgi:hypothetical protein
MAWWDSPDDREGVPFAVDAQGVWRDVDDVPRGKACACYCADCRAELIARQGNVRVHHFAHSDRRECRHALETSLFGMAISVLGEPDARLALPASGDREALAAEFGLGRDSSGHEPIVLEESLPLAGATFSTPGGADAAIDRPEILIPGKVAIHLLSYRKTYQQLRAVHFTGDTGVLGINLRIYAQRWWQVCDEQKEKRIAAALQATTLLREWLADDISGRGWFYHPQVASERAKLAARRKEEEARQAQRMLEARTAPPVNEHPLAHRATPLAAERAARPLEFMKPVRSEVRIVLTEEHAMEIGLLWHVNLRRWYCVVRAGEVAPSAWWDLMACDQPWLPVLAGERQYLLARPPRTTIARESRPQTEPTPSPATRASQEPAEDIILNTGVGKCWCGAVKNEVQFAGGLYSGRRGIRCSANPKHPISVHPKI